MAQFCKPVDLKRDGKSAFSALVASLSSASGTSSLRAVNCNANNVKDLVTALLNNSHLLRSIEVLELSSTEADGKLKLHEAGATELSRCNGLLTRLKSLNLYCSSVLDC
jgi:hypothetical protein